MEKWLDPASIRFSLLLLVGGAAAMLIASRAAADALSSRQNPHVHPGGLAAGHWLGIACVCLAALAWGYPEIALGVIFSTSVAALSLVLGICVYAAPMTAPPGEGRAVWPFILPAGVIALLAGLSGKITLVHAGAMLLLGLVLLPVTANRDDPPTGRRFGVASILQLALALTLAGLSAWAMVRGTGQIHQQSRFFSAPLITAVAISPALMLPALWSGAALVRQGKSTLVLTVLTRIVLLNLCLLLPLVALLWRGRQDSPIVYPLLLWRLDTFLLVSLGVMMLPVSTGRWMLGRYEGIGLMIGYGMYLMLTVAMNLR